MDVFDGLREAFLNDRSQFFKDIPSGPFFGFNREGAKISQGIIDSWWMQGMMSGFKKHLLLHPGLFRDGYDRGFEEIRCSNTRYSR